MTGLDIETRVRTLLKSGSEVRWDDAELLLWVNDGVREIVRRRPDAQYTATINNAAIIDITDLSETLVLVEYYRATMTNYVLHRCYQKDAEYSNGREMSEYWWNMFIKELV